MKVLLSLVLAASMPVFMIGCACGKTESEKNMSPPRQECKKSCDKKDPKSASCCKRTSKPGDSKAGKVCCKNKPCCSCKKPAVKKAAGKVPVKKAEKKPAAPAAAPASTAAAPSAAAPAAAPAPTAAAPSAAAPAK